MRTIIDSVRRRRQTIAAAALLLAASAPATAQDLGAFAGKDVTFVLWGLDAYQQANGAWFEKVLKDAGANSVTLVDGKVDPQVQQKAMDDAIAAGADAIALFPAQPAASVTSILASQQAGIPLVLAGATPDPASATVPAALIDDSSATFVAGQNAANWLKANRPDEKAKLVVFDLMTVTYCKDLRMDGFIAGVTDVMGADNVEIKFRDTVEHKREVALAKMEDQLTRDPDFNIFTACGADGVLGGIAGLEAAGRARAVDKVPQTEYIFTIDGTPSELERLFNSESAVMETLTLTPKENAIKTAELLGRVVSGDLAPDATDTVALSGMLLPPNCTETAHILQEQYGMLSDFKPIDCSAYQ